MIAQVLAWIVLGCLLAFVGGVIGSSGADKRSRITIGIVGSVGILAAIALAIMVIGGGK